MIQFKRNIFKFTFITNISLIIIFFYSHYIRKSNLFHLDARPKKCAHNNKRKIFKFSTCLMLCVSHNIKHERNRKMHKYHAISQNAPQKKSIRISIQYKYSTNYRPFPSSSAICVSVCLCFYSDALSMQKLWIPHTKTFPIQSLFRSHEIFSRKMTHLF
jgi:hypothetical protein